MEPGIHADRLGIVTIVDDDGEQLVKFSRPKFGQWRAVNEHLRPYLEAITSLNDARRTLLVESSDKDRKAARQLLDTEGKKPAVEVVEPMVRWILDAVPHEGGLPESVDDWPTWLANDMMVPIDIAGYWTRRPKASGPTDPPS